MKRLILPSRWGFRNVSSSWVSKPGRCIRISIFKLGSRPLLDLLNVDQEIYQARFSQVLTESQLRSLELDCLFSTGKMRSVFALEKQNIQGVEIRP